MNAHGMLQFTRFILILACTFTWGIAEGGGRNSGSRCPCPFKKTPLTTGGNTSICVARLGHKLVTRSFIDVMRACRAIGGHPITHKDVVEAGSPHYMGIIVNKWPNIKWYNFSANAIDVYDGFRALPIPPGSLAHRSNEAVVKIKGKYTVMSVNHWRMVWVVCEHAQMPASFTYALDNRERETKWRIINNPNYGVFVHVPHVEACAARCVRVRCGRFAFRAVGGNRHADSSGECAFVPWPTKKIRPKLKGSLDKWRMYTTSY